MNFFLVFCLLETLSFCLVSSEQPPHIVFVLADDLGYNDVGYHNPKIRTPNINQLASEGVILENYYVQTVCSPTRSQLMSGRYQIHTGLQHGVIEPEQPNGLPLDIPTMADLLKEAGYSTHMVGKWHLGFFKHEYLPTRRGFDSFYGYLTGAEDYFTHERCVDEICGLDLWDNETPVTTEKGHYSTNLFTSKAVEIVEKHNSSKPLFLYLPYQAVHAPLEVPDRYLHQYNFITNLKRRKYAGMVSCLDEGVGNLTNALKRAGMWDNTIFIFSTDNGGPNGSANNYPLRGHKATLWEGGIRGVGFVHGRRLTQHGVRNTQLIHVSDWLPTFLHLAGHKPNDSVSHKLDGFDQWDAISNGMLSPRLELLHNIDPLHPAHGHAMVNVTFNTTIHAAIRVGEYKLLTGNPGDGGWYVPPEDADHLVTRHPVRQPERNVRLFNIVADPEEVHDVSEQHPALVKSMLARIHLYYEGSVPVRFPANQPAASNPAKQGGHWGPWM